ncbi:hypothetical protein SEA_BENCZKOWSKI14_70 [Gordonia phage Benczkowski14]|uniref:Uncharacterized protein n=2 Tax=Demosthenesvirus katyusha TaxID=1982108 RepID=A0A142KCE7_9CAUD|nr:hypothetical protein FDH67_gp70 [Gordonia phage Katyusha]AMS03462.1 hypothetical protein SEA_KATYUSHA_69 [Gordonia phage Katyusha]AMS03780.1 hypothetical protein SEA_BENCZKOWSKI14_70 [Gordonia phage Benczkowski14]
MSGWPEIFPTLDLPENEGREKYTYECGVAGCHWRTFHRSKEGAYAERTRHQSLTCPYKIEEGPLNDPNGLPPMEAMWAKLDQITKYLIENKSNIEEWSEPDDTGQGQKLVDGYIRMQGEAQGLAYSIWLVSPLSHFPDVKAVAQWARKRYRMNRGELDYAQTPGCRTDEQIERGRAISAGEVYMGEPPKQRKPKRPPTGPAADPKTGKFKALKESDLAAIKKMHGNFPKETIMSILKISSDQYDHEAAKLDGS